MIENIEHSPLPERKINRAILVPADGSSAEASCEPQAKPARCCCGGLVRLRSLGLVCVAQAVTALVMAALGIVDRFTVYPACYFSLSTFVGVWLMRDKPNNRGQRTRPLVSENQKTEAPTSEPRPGSL